MVDLMPEVAEDPIRLGDKRLEYLFDHHPSGDETPANGWKESVFIPDLDKGRLTSMSGARGERMNDAHCSMAINYERIPKPHKLM
jgi:hypothetical protein